MAKIKGTVGTITETVDGKKQKVSYDRSVTVEYPLPLTMKDALERYGEEVCISMIQRSTVISGRNKINNFIVQGATEKDINKYFDGWTPPLGNVGQRKSPAEKMATKLNKMSKDEREAALVELQKLLSADAEAEK